MNNDALDLFKNPLKFNFKNIIVLILLLTGLYLLLPKIVGLEQALKLVIHINKFYLIIALIFEVLSYVGAAWLLGIIFDQLGHKLPFLTRFRLGSIAAFTIHFVPLGSAGEAAFDYYFLRKQKVDSGSIVLMWILRWVFTYAGFFLVFLIGLILVPTYPKLPFSPRIISPVLFIAIVGSVSYLIYLYQHKDKFWRSFSGLFNLVNKFLKKFKKDQIAEDKKQEVFDDIYQGIGLFGRKKRSSVYAVLCGMLYWLGDITCFYFVFQAFGIHIGWGILIFSYCVSTILGVISAIPGGMGVTEGSMALILAGMGIPGTLALTATLVFRLFSFWIWIPIGFFSYLSLRKPKQI